MTKHKSDQIFEAKLGVGTESPTEKVDIRGGYVVLSPDDVGLGSMQTGKFNRLTIYSSDYAANNNPANLGLVQANGPGVNSTNPCELSFSATKSTIAQLAAGTNTAVENGTILGAIHFYGDDGTDMREVSAFMRVVVDTTNDIIGSNKVPSNMTFGTWKKGDVAIYTNAAQRMTIDHIGNVGIGHTSPVNKLDVSGGVVIGAGVSGVDTAPTNGILVEGEVSSQTKLSIENGSYLDSDSIFFVKNTPNVPSGYPLTGGYLYVENGALKYVGSSGTITTIANA